MQKIKPSDLWTICGALFGVLFPVLAVTIRFVQFGETGSFAASLTDPLLLIICTAPLFLGILARIGGKQFEKVLYYTSILEKNVSERTGELRKTDKALTEQLNEKNCLLNGIPAGVFYFDKTGAMSDERSGFLRVLLPETARMTSVYDFLQKYLAKSPQEIQVLMDLLWNQEGTYYHFETIAGKFGTEFTTRDEDTDKKYFSIEYIEMKNDDHLLEKIVVIITDETKNHQANMLKKKQDERIHQIEIASTNTEVYLAFSRETSGLITLIDQCLNRMGDSTMKKILGYLHTLKGNVASFGHDTASMKIHSLENTATESFSQEAIQKFGPGWRAFKKEWKRQDENLKSVLGLTKVDRNIVVNKTAMKKLSEYAGSESPELNDLFEALNRFPLQDLLLKNIAYIEKLAQRKSKKVRIVVAPDSDEFTIEEFSCFDGLVNHLLKNSLDHGIEDSVEREKNGKHIVGTIILSGKRLQESLVLKIEDDGKGVDLSALRQEAVRLNIWSKEKQLSASDEEVADLIFLEDISESQEVDEVSGRGIGLNIVREEARRMGGGLQVSTRAGLGTCFCLILSRQKLLGNK